MPKPKSFKSIINSFVTPVDKRIYPVFSHDDEDDRLKVSIINPSFGKDVKKLEDTLLEEGYTNPEIQVKCIKGDWTFTAEATAPQKKGELTVYLSPLEDYLRKNEASVVQFQATEERLNAKAIPELGKLASVLVTKFDKKGKGSTRVLLPCYMVRGQYYGTRGISNTWTIRPVLQIPDDQGVRIELGPEIEANYCWFGTYVGDLRLSLSVVYSKDSESQKA